MRQCHAGDGAGSQTREELGIALEGRPALQSLINVHFTSRQLASALQSDAAMLYFVYARTTVLVIVAHDLSAGPSPRLTTVHVAAAAAASGVGGQQFTVCQRCIQSASCRSA